MFIESLNYPFDTKTILRKRRSILKELSLQKDLKDIKVALLGGSTTSDILNFVEIFLLNAGFRPTFFESEYGKYFEDVVVDDSELRAFKPDIVFIHTTHVNLINAPNLFSSDTEVESCLRAEMEYDGYVKGMVDKYYSLVQLSASTYRENMIEDLNR